MADVPAGAPRPETRCLKCDAVATVHIVEIHCRFLFWPATQRERHYCRAHAPADLSGGLLTPEAQIKALQRMSAQLDVAEIDPEQKSRQREVIQQMIDDIRSGRRSLDDGK